VVRALSADKFSSSRECAQRSGAQLYILAEDEGLKGPCPRPLDIIRTQYSQQSESWIFISTHLKIKIQI